MLCQSFPVCVRISPFQGTNHKKSHPQIELLAVANLFLPQAFSDPEMWGEGEYESGLALLGMGAAQVAAPPGQVGAEPTPPPPQPLGQTDTYPSGQPLLAKLGTPVGPQQSLGSRVRHGSFEAVVASVPDCSWTQTTCVAPRRHAPGCLPNVCKRAADRLCGE